ncbi:MAG: NAD(P)-binding domain-containing protein [Flavobacteriales bacterium]|nr:NAD(P)-binding domain-containing protein [Flavobacteriales bacterium]
MGSGVVGRTLAMGLSAHGHTVCIGTRTPEKLAKWHTAHPAVQIVTPHACASDSEIVILAVKGTAAIAALKLAGVEHLNGKVVIDTTNPIADVPPTDGVLSFFTDANMSLLEHLQDTFPEIRLVKAWNSVGSAHMVDPDFGAERPTMFICGDDNSAKETVSEILRQTGWEPEDMGKSIAARAIEPLCILWCIPGFLGKGWHHAFKLLKAGPKQ